ncbi:unnamed protein product, partial [Candidula unifasciata]
QTSVIANVPQRSGNQQAPNRRRRLRPTFPQPSTSSDPQPQHSPEENYPSTSGVARNHHTFNVPVLETRPNPAPPSAFTR